MALTTSKEYDGDVLETALTFGINYAINKHNSTYEIVQKLVNKFKVEINDLCDCKKEELKGNTVMCSNCTGNKY